jgi:hypothetical protein
MRPWIERREFRLLAEMTAEQFRVLQERDRGLADQFHVLPVREPSESETRRILIHVVRRMEAEHECRFDLEVVPAAMDLQRRYVRDQAMPGKAAGFVAQLGLKYREREITRGDALREFSAKSGLAVGFLDTAAKLERREVVEALSKRVIGQTEAVAALADVVAIAKARLNDPGRPLGTFLFLGPTGVGKTQTAKSLAAYLYGDESRLVRFDMNEYVEPSSLARLIGTFAQPEGLLTSAVRRQPYCVLLLDEVEKADPGVFDLLLQVLGEGRLTDAVGRTSDFTNAIIVMTSNLGTREASSSFGLKPAKASRREVFLDAARGFFRPEFFNRIDRIVPFEPLEREDIAAIARQLISGLFGREGLVHRRCVLRVEPAAMGRIIEQGYHPQLGARALKRAVEKQLTQPIANRLATMSPEAPTVVTIYPCGEGVVPHTQALVNVEPIEPAGVDFADRDAVLTRAEEFLNEVEARNPAAVAGAAGDGKVVRVSADALSAAHFRYFAIREQIGRIDAMIRQIDQAAESAAKRAAAGRRILGQRVSRTKAPKRLRRVDPSRAEYAAVLAARDVHAQLAELAESAEADEQDERLADLLGECAMLAALERSGAGRDRMLVEIRYVSEPPTGVQIANVMREAYLRVFARRYGFSSAVVEVAEDETSQFVLLEMPGVAGVFEGERGTHLMYPAGENLVPVQVNLIPLVEGADSAVAAKEHLASRRRWREAVAAGRGRVEEDPTPLGPVVRVYDPGSVTLDLRTGLLCPSLATAEDVRRFIVGRLGATDQSQMKTDRKSS